MLQALGITALALTALSGLFLIALVLRRSRRRSTRCSPTRSAGSPAASRATRARRPGACFAGTERRRWHRGLGETLWRHRRVAGNGRYGVLGLAAVPYFLLFEFFGPIFEVLGIPAVLGWWLLGDLSVVFLVGFLLIALLVGVVLSLAALTLEEHSFRRHRDGRDIARLVRFSVLENVGYRQLVSFWRFLAFFDLVRGHREWGEMPRRGFRTVPEAPLPPA